MFERYTEISIPDVGLVRDDSGAYRVYRDPAGVEYMSVTSFLSRALPEDKALAEWKAQVGEEVARDISAYATKRGSAIHDALDKLINNMSEKEQESGLSIFEKPDFRKVAKHLKEKVGLVLANEIFMRSKKMKLAGAADLLAFYEGILSVVDFKTSGREKYLQDIDSYFLQCAIYALMCFEATDVLPKQLVIVMIIEQDKVKVFKQDSIPWVKQALQLHKDYTRKVANNA